MVDMPRSKPGIFISHSHQDVDFCRAYANGLRAYHLNVWYDEHNFGWGRLQHVFKREIEGREHFVAVLSPAAIASKWVQFEIDAALKLLDKGSLRTLQFVIAKACKLPPHLLEFKRIEGRRRSPLEMYDAVDRTIRVLADADPELAWYLNSVEPPIPPERFPRHLAQLGYSAHVIRGIEIIVPPVCDIPTGEFIMGSDSRVDAASLDDERPQLSVTLATYQMTRFPVTVAEFSCFVHAGGNRPRRSLFGEHDWESQLHWLDHPVGCISHADALSYIQWLREVTGMPWRLPSEAEWEKAARWHPTQHTAYVYPWGNMFDKNRCNTHESGLGTTVPVGIYPAGASPYGVQDLAGNVWEWTSSIYGPYDSGYTGSDDAGREGDFVVRGGSWAYDARYARTAARLHLSSDTFYDYVGFRLVR